MLNQQFIKTKYVTKELCNRDYTCNGWSTTFQSQMETPLSSTNIYYSKKNNTETKCETVSLRFSFVRKDRQWTAFFAAKRLN